jgi:hypothetical protein
MALLSKSATRTVDRVDESLVAVDAALAMASRSRLVTVDEALKLLRNVEAAVGGRDNRVASIVGESARAWEGQLMLDRANLMDTLLDIRLVTSD